MAKAPDTTNTDGTPKKKRTRSNKPKRFYMIFEGDAPTNVSFAKNGDDALDIVDAASKEGKKLNFLRVNLPASKPKDAPAA